MLAILARIEAWIADRRGSGDMVTVSSLGKRATGSPDTIRNWIRSRDAGQRIGATALKVEQVAHAMGVSAEWLIAGEGDPRALPVPGVDPVPLISWVSAGQLAEQDGIIDFENFPRIYVADLPPGRWIALRVDGNSMNKISPHDSVIIVNMNDRGLVSGKCYVVADEATGEATYKAYDPKADPPFQPRSYLPIDPPKFVGPALVVGRVHRTMLDL
ncbi:hypothetical protein XINFAN_02022 [Pseudogemmobacter humi]|uniref:Peptidase S24/S26A/S26B/S26C domain-containing protein n=2 Tax=Pseudogemmobacter humi TaxID=2483812 RepID=A0A3P5XDE1_9RHOB|nr:hypothetical protein XINFAN_02022 [Pseudogemmobacter humi]